MEVKVEQGLDDVEFEEQEAERMEWEERLVEMRIEKGKQRLVKVHVGYRSLDVEWGEALEQGS